MTHLRTPDFRDAAAMEKAEAKAFRLFLDGAPAATREQLGIRTVALRDGLATAMKSDTSGYWSKAMGFGFDLPIDEGLVVEIVDFFRSSSVPQGVIAISPSVQPENWDEICTRNGLIPGSTWAKLACPVDQLHGGSTDYPIRELEADDAVAYGQLVSQAFGMSEPDLTPLLRAALECPDVRAFGAFDDGSLIGAGAVTFADGTAAFNTGATLSSHRGRGVHSALISARAGAAAEAGCRLLSVETGSAIETNGSFRNLLRAGFEHRYSRQNWLLVAS